MSKKKTLLILLGIILVAAIVRVLGVLFWAGLTFDEILSVSVAQHSFTQMWTYLRWELHPPLHFLYLSVWLKLFGNSEIVIRLSSALLGVVSIYVMYLLGRDFFQKREAGIYAALLTGFSLVTLVYSSVARMYALLFLLGALSFYFFYKLTTNNSLLITNVSRLVKSKRHFGNLILYSLTTLLALYTHLTALTIPLIQGLYLWHLAYKRKIEFKKIKIISYNLLFIILLYLPWLVLFVQARTKIVAGVPWFALSQPLETFFINLPVQLIFGQPASVIALVGTFFLIGLVFASLFRIERINPGRWKLRSYLGEARLLALLILLIPLIVLFALNLHTLRFNILSSIGIILLLSAGSISIRSDFAKKLSIIVLLALLLIPTLNSLALPDPAWPEIAGFIESREQGGDILLAAYSSDMLALNYYYKGELVAHTLADRKAKASSLDELELAMRTNSHIYVNSQTIAEVSELIDGTKRVFLVFDTNTFGDTYRLYIDWFLDHGWQRIDYLVSGANQSERVWLLIDTKTEKLKDRKTDTKN